MMILIASPYRGGTYDDAVLVKKNLDKLKPVALPLMQLAGSKATGVLKKFS